MGGGRGDWVACATVRLRNSAEILVSGPHGYQDLSNRNDWPVKNATADLPIRPGLLEAWLVLTSVKYHRNLYILIPLNQRLALTRLRATGPRMTGNSNHTSCSSESVGGPEQRSRRRFADVTNQGYITPATQAGEGGGGGGGGGRHNRKSIKHS